MNKTVIWLAVLILFVIAVAVKGNEPVSAPVPDVISLVGEKPIPIPVPIKIAGDTLTAVEYTALKTNIKARVTDMARKNLTLKERDQWIGVVSRELKNCQLKDVTEANLIEKLNSCIK